MAEEYIKRSVAIHAIQRHGVGSFDFEEDGWTPEQAERFVISEIKKLPSEDVAPVVRCKDCEYHRTVKCKMDIWTTEARQYRAQDNDFCSYGMKKDG